MSHYTVPHHTTFASHLPQGFMLVGGNGFIAVYERVDDKKEPYIETKRLALGALQLKYAAVFPSEVQEMKELQICYFCF